MIPINLHIFSIQCQESVTKKLNQKQGHVINIP